MCEQPRTVSCHGARGVPNRQLAGDNPALWMAAGVDVLASHSPLDDFFVIIWKVCSFQTEFGMSSNCSRSWWGYLDIDHDIRARLGLQNLRWKKKHFLTALTKIKYLYSQTVGCPEQLLLRYIMYLTLVTRPTWTRSDYDIEVPRSGLVLFIIINFIFCQIPNLDIEQRTLYIVMIEILRRIV